MGVPVVMGAQLKCSFGAAPSGLLVVPTGPPVLFEKKPVATVMDFVPMKNILPFGMCNSLSNPPVPPAPPKPMTPVPCMPIITGPWKPGSPTVKAGQMNVLNKDSICQCVWAGVITVVNPGTTKETVP